MIIFKRIVIALLIQMLFLASITGQKYQNGTKLLKGAEVLSATPLQLDYVLDQLADTANIKVNLHEGKTHLVLDDGSGDWREWWYYKNRWRVKTPGTSKETDPTVPAHVKSITLENITNWNKHKDEKDPVWLADKDEYYTKLNLQAVGQSQVHWGNITDKPPLGAGTVTHVGLSLPDIFTIAGSPVTGNGTLAATLKAQPKSTVLAAPVTADGQPGFRKLMETDIPDLNWSKINNKPDVYTKNETKTLAGDTAIALRNYVKNRKVAETDPVWLAAKKNYYEKWQLEGWRQAKVNYGNLSDYPPLFDKMNSNEIDYKFENSGETTRSKVGFSTTALDLYAGKSYEGRGEDSWMQLNGNYTQLTVSKRSCAPLAEYCQTDIDDRSTFFIDLDKIEHQIANEHRFELNKGYIYKTILTKTDFQHSYSWPQMPSWERPLVNFRSSMTDSTVYVAKRIRLGLESESYISDEYGRMKFRDNTGTYALSELVPKIYREKFEPAIGEETCAFWIDDAGDFYILLRSNGVQKKLKMQ